MIGIIDYSMGNLQSISNAIRFLGEEFHFVYEPEELAKYDKIVLPGVGAFAKAMQNLSAKHLHTAIKDFANSGKPMLGICLGMQILATNGYEPHHSLGLGLIDGDVEKLTINLPVPHVGWNEVLWTETNNLNLKAKEKVDYYFVHSYHFIPKDEKNILAYTDYGVPFVSAVIKDNIIGLQFHPEKSQKNGLRLLENFIKL